MYRETTVLNGPWLFHVDIFDEGENRKWYSPEYPHTSWGRATVPQAWDCFEEAMWGFEGIGWYQTTIAPLQPPAGSRVMMHFGRVNYHARVWINGNFIGENCNGYIPFSFDISDLAAAGEPLLLVIRVDNRPQKDWLPGGTKIEWMQYGGILQPVWIERTGPVFLADLHVHACPDNGDGLFECTARIHNTDAAPWSGEVTVNVPGAAVPACADVSLEPGKSTDCRLNLVVRDAAYWTPDTPALYRVTATLQTGGAVCDQRTVRTGVRSITARGTDILLNNEPIYIKGINRYDEIGRSGPTPSEELIREDLRLIKETGINCIRTHYPQDPRLLDLLDEAGLMLMEEIPVNWWGTKTWDPDNEPTEAMWKPASTTLDVIMKRDRGHPCLIAWSMANESATDQPAGIDMMRRLMQRARGLDPHRLVTFVVAGDTKNHLALEKADVICTNAYPGLNPYPSQNRPRCHHPDDMTDLVQEAVKEHLQKQVDAWPGKPVLMTEFGAWAIYGRTGTELYAEGYQAAYLEHLVAGMQSVPGVAGGMLWAWADYYHRRDFFQYAAFGPYGVVTTDRKIKQGRAALQRAFAALPSRKKQD